MFVKKILADIFELKPIVVTNVVDGIAMIYFHVGVQIKLKAEA